MLTGKISIVTGSSSGLGRAIALNFAKQGASVVCADRGPTSPGHEIATHDLLTQQGSKSIFVPTDVSDESCVQKVVQDAVRQYGRLDIMVNNAGIAHEASSPRPVWETPLDVFDSTWKINVRGVFLGCKYAGHQMLNQDRISGEKRNGTIINIASVLGILGKEGTTAYATSKGAVIALTRTVAMDYAPHGIHFTRTPMISSMTSDNKLETAIAASHPLRRLGEPNEIAKAAEFLASHMSDGITGLNMSVDGGLHGKLGL